MDLFQWIEETLHPVTCNSEEFIYEDMDSQSGRSLPLIYKPFDILQKSHWCDRGSLFDFLYSVQGEGKRLLDFGPGDGWPSLIIAPYAGEVVGVDGSKRRVLVCTENAKRLGISNAKFIFVSPGTSLPFEDDSFDGIMAATSIEQTPAPQATLKELFRVLRKGGCLRLNCESLNGYRNGLEHDLWLWAIGAEHCRMIIFDRDIKHEFVRQYGLTYTIPKQAMTRLLSTDGQALTFSMISVDGLKAISSSLIDARECITIHPSGKTLVKWLHEFGFSQVNPTHSGADAAGMLFDRIPETGRPLDMAGVDKLVRPVAEIACELPAPLYLDPMITAIK